jgi:hypothetical protein
MGKKYHACLSCQKLILTPNDYDSCNCSARKPSREKIELTEEDKVKWTKNNRL